MTAIASPGRVRRHAWAGYLVVTGVLSLLYLFGKGTPLNSGPVFNVFGLSSIVAIVGAIRMHGVARLPWALIAAGLAAFVAGDVLAYNYTRFFGTDLPFPSIADGFYLATYPLLIAGLLLLVRKRTPSHDRAALIDALIVSTSAGALSWTLLIAPYAHDSSLSVSTKLTSIAYPIMDLAVAACVARLAFGQGRRSPSFVFLTVGVACLLGTDSIYGWALLHGGYATGGLLDAGWIAFYLLMGAAALHPNAPVLVESARDTQFRLTPQRITGLASCAIVAPVVLAIDGARAGVGDVSLLAACSGAVFLMVFMRLLDLGRRHEAGLRRATVLATAGVGLVEARSAAEVQEVASSAGREMLGPSSEVSLSDARGVAAGELAATTGSSLTLPLQGRHDSHGLLVAKTGAPVDADTLEGIRTLANEVALALDGIEMADQLLKQRAEARFQALVQHSSDAILLLDAGGLIEWASPSTRRVLSETPSSLEQRRLLDLVAEQDRPRIAQAILGDHASAPTKALEFGLVSARGLLEVEAICTNLLRNEDIRGIVLNVRDISERKSFERQLEHQAFHDEVTGLANRALFRDRVDHALQRVRRGGSIAVLFVDLDDFKTVNDTLGHQAGDQLIRAVADRITRTARSIDTAARLGGDEFAVLLEDDDQVDPKHVGERLLETIAAPVEIDGKQLAVTASIGIARAEAGKAISVDDLLRDADVAMYSAKANGKGICRTFESEMHVALLGRLELKRELQLALERKEFELKYQPIVDLSTGAFDSLEALIRWNHPERGTVAPDQFIPLAEETGAIVSIGRWVLREACVEAAKLERLAGGSAPKICVNVSGRQLQEPELVNDVMRILSETGLPPEKLVLEITETVMISDLELALGRLKELSAQGIWLAVDDFGSGYSSLNYIRRFPINILKMDRGFIADLNTSAEVASLTRTILDLARILGVTPVAEGIERQDQLDELRELGCVLGQGFLFMRPVAAAEIEQEILRRLAEPQRTKQIA
jgi:diguanylate cyclase (GGDEF)-like protein/PAS domain S-box-containing protein